MRTTLKLFVLSLLVISVMPAVLATDVGASIGIDIVTEDFEPRVWMCDDRIVFDDETEPGRISRHQKCLDEINAGNEEGVSSFDQCAYVLKERRQNYAFEGEQILWNVLVFDKNGIEKIEDVFATIGSTRTNGEIEVNCILDEILNDESDVDESCNARILEEEISSFSDNTAAYYTCILTVETAESMYGEFFVTIEARDLDGLSGYMDEFEYWFFNPVIALAIDGDLVFDNVRPGTSSYSETIIVTNDADVGSGVMMDMFITGTDFYDSSSSGAKCPVSNQLELENFMYFATNGAYSSIDDPRAGVENYVPIEYGIGFNNPNPFYDSAEILQAGPGGPYYGANILSPGSDMALTFRLDLPEPCHGDFDTGAIHFWGEAI